MHTNKFSNSYLSTYLTPVVLGMEDALIELTGALAGFTIALGDTRLVALAGLTTGVAATLSMGASEFLSLEATNGKRHAFRAAISCGGAYLLTVALLLFPFFIFPLPAKALCLSLFTAAIIIVVYSFFVSKIQDLNFFRCFSRMISISFGVGVVAFTITWLAQILWGTAV